MRVPRSLVVLLALLAFAGTLLSQLPASLVTSPLDGLLEPRWGLALRGPRGTVWRGEARLDLGTEPVAQVAWRFPQAAWPPALGVSVTSVYGAAEARAVPGTEGGLRVHVDALDVPLAAANRHLRGVGLDLSGRLLGSNFVIEVPPSGTPRTDTVLRYSGGRNQYQVGADWFVADLPPLPVALSAADGRLTVRVTHQEAPVLRLEVHPEGRYRVDVHEAAVRLTGHPWEVSERGDAVVFSLEEALR